MLFNFTVRVTLVGSSLMVIEDVLSYFAEI